MNVVVHHHAPNTCDARHVENFLAAREQPPILHHFCVAHASQRCAGIRDILVKHREQFLSVFNLRWLKTRPAHRRIIQFFGLDRHWQPFHHRGHVAGKPADGARLVVRLPVPLFIGTSFQNFAGVLHFLVELTKHHLSNGHDSLPFEFRDFRARIIGEQKANCQGLLSTTRESILPPANSALLSCANDAIGHFKFTHQKRPFDDALDSFHREDKMTLWHTNSPLPT